MQTHTEERMHIKVQLDEGATMPRRAHESDVGYDVTAVSYELYGEDGRKTGMPESGYTCVIETIKVDTGVHVEPPPGYYFELVPNSRISKTHFFMANSPGIIDQDYRGSIKAVFKKNVFYVYDDYLEYFKPGKVIGQLILRKRESLPLVQADELSNTERGTGGFGSTEKKQ